MYTYIGFGNAAGIGIFQGIQSFQNQTGNSSLAEDFVGGRSDYQLPPSNDVRRLGATLKRMERWQEQLQKDFSSEKDFGETGQCLVTFENGDLGMVLEGEEKSAKSS